LAYKPSSRDSDIDFEKDKDNNLLTVSHGSNTKVTIELDPEYEHLANLRILNNGKEVKHKRVYIRTQHDKKNIFFVRSDDIRVFERSITYLKCTLAEKTQKLIEKLRQSTTGKTFKEKIKIQTEITSLETNRGNWRYSLDIRGFIIYLLGEIELQREEHKVHNQRISKLLENLSKHYLEDFPFLMYDGEFKKEYETLEKDGKVPKNFEIELLKKVAEELRFQVHTASKDFLKYWITRRYSGELTRYFIITFMIEWPVNIDKYLHFLSFKKLLEYQLKNLQIIREYLEYECKDMNGAYDLLSDEHRLQLYF
jgi:hypothetical protein